MKSLTGYQLRRSEYVSHSFAVGVSSLRLLIYANTKSRGSKVEKEEEMGHTQLSMAVD